MIKYPAHLVKILEAIRARLGEHYPLGIELNDDVCRRHLAEGSSYFD